MQVLEVDGKLILRFDPNDEDIVSLPARLNSNDIDYVMRLHSGYQITTMGLRRILAEFVKSPAIGVVYTDTQKTYRLPLNPRQPDILPITKACVVSIRAAEEFGVVDTIGEPSFVEKIASCYLISHVAEPLTTEP